MKRFWIALLITLLTIGFALPALAQDEAGAAAKAMAYLETIQNDDGGFSNGFAPESDISATADAVIALVAAGEDPNAWFTGDQMNPFSFLGIQAEGGSINTAGLLAKTLTAVIASGKDMTAFGGHNLVDDLLAVQGETGLFGAGAFDHCLSLIALQNAGAELPEGSIEALLALQSDEGGWGFVEGEAADTNTTGLCLQALALTDQAEAVAAGLDYLRSIQNEDGGWPYQNPSEFGTDSDVNSTALVVQALLANGEDLAAWNNPQDWLLGMQGESGAFNYQEAMPGDNILATLAAIPAIQGMPLNAWVLEPEAEG
jgi:prenyltransferase beta subunit